MAKLTSKARNALSAGSFALPKSRSYPIPDASHARNALARASQHASPGQRSEIAAKVHAKFPGIGKPKKMAEGSPNVSARISFPPRKTAGYAMGSPNVGRESMETRRATSEHGYTCR